jgi:hypothetical protein
MMSLDATRTLNGSFSVKGRNIVYLDRTGTFVITLFWHPVRRRLDTLHNQNQ